MDTFNYFELTNGLKVYVIEDDQTSLAVVNLLYSVGSRDENPEETGFAHLFEHLMFGGSGSVPHYDKEIQMLAGDNNAFTSPDITNYYVVLPSNNLEAALRIEADRMLDLTLNQEVLDVQKGVVEEEFKQRYLNQPYGDIWFYLREMAYREHPYRWPTIGKEIDHVRNATLQMVHDFSNKYYIPNNAILVVAGDVKTADVERKVNKWFGTIPSGTTVRRNYSAEPQQLEAREMRVKKKVPLNAIYKVFHGPERNSDAYYDMDLLSDLLSRGQSSLFYKRFVKNDKLLSSVRTSMIGSLDPGLFYFHGQLNQEADFDTVEKVLHQQLETLTTSCLEEKVVKRAKIKGETSLVFSRVELLNRAMSLAISANMGVPELITADIDRLMAVTPERIMATAKEVLRPENASTLYYEKE